MYAKKSIPLYVVTVSSAYARRQTTKSFFVLFVQTHHTATLTLTMPWIFAGAVKVKSITKLSQQHQQFLDHAGNLLEKYGWGTSDQLTKHRSQTQHAGHDEVDDKCMVF
jgi:hypothetical protein